MVLGHLHSVPLNASALQLTNLGHSERGMYCVKCIQIRIEIGNTTAYLASVVTIHTQPDTQMSE